MNQPIFVVGAGRSGSAMILQLLHHCGAFIGTVGKNDKYCEHLGITKIVNPYINNLKNLSNSLYLFMSENSKIEYPKHWKDIILTQLYIDHFIDGPWAIKGSYLAYMWPIWKCAFPSAKWVIVRRRTGDVISSYMKTNYMTTFKTTKNQSLVGASCEQEAWLWLIYQYEESFINLINSGVDYKIVWPERMAYYDYTDVKNMVEWAGLQWNEDAYKFINPKFEKTRIKENIRRIYE